MFLTSQIFFCYCFCAMFQTRKTLSFSCLVLFLLPSVLSSVLGGDPGRLDSKEVLVLSLGYEMKVSHVSIFLIFLKIPFHGE